MAQPMYAIRYLGAMFVIKNTPYTSASILAAYPTANMLIMKTDNIKVSITGTDMFSIKYDDQSYIASGQSYVFNLDCVIAIGAYVVVS